MRRIVIADNDIATAERLKTILMSESFEVFIARTGADASEMIYGLKPELLITAVVLKEKDGYELISETKQILPQTRIIAMTSGGSESSIWYLDALRTLGVQLTLIKPFRDAYFIKVVKAALDD